MPVALYERAAAPPAPIDGLEASAYAIPTEYPESDGTYSWDSVTLVVAEVSAGGRRGLGYTYAEPSLAAFIAAKLGPVVRGRDVMDVPALWRDLHVALRNLGRPGLCSMAISAVDVALWDLKAQLLGVSLAKLLGLARPRVAAYGSGGFTSYPMEKLKEQLAGWASEGFSRVKMKVGRHPEQDQARVEAARDALGADVELFVDANGAYSRKQALQQAAAFARLGVRWLEEPVSSDDLEGLRLLRDRAPAGMEISAGEYGWDAFYFRRMLEAGAVDVLQADATRCGGATGLLHAAALCEAFAIPLSTHAAPALHVPLACALPALRHLEYFHDHVRVERMLFDGVPQPRHGSLAPDLSRAGLGLVFKRADAERLRAR